MTNWEIGEVLSVGPVRKRLREKARAGVPFVSSPFPVTGGQY